MNFSLPTGNEIRLGEDPPERPDTFPPDLRTISDSVTDSLIQRFDCNLQETYGGGVNNWVHLNDRIGFIVALFPSRQQDLSLFEPPFSKIRLESSIKEAFPMDYPNRESSIFWVEVGLPP